MKTLHLHRGDAHYPDTLFRCLRERAPATLSAIGNVELLKTRPLALFCSVKCSGSLILQTYDLAQRLRESGTSIIGGFHSPVERECLTILLRGKNPIMICLARGVERMRIPKEYRKPLDDGRLLLLSPFSDNTHRADARLATARNTVVAALADQVFVAHAEPGSKTESLCRNILQWRKPLYVFADNSNPNLLTIGAKPTTVQELLSELSGR